MWLIGGHGLLCKYTPPARVSISNVGVFDFSISPANAIARWEANTNGQARTYRGSTGYTNLSGQWKISGLSTDYDIRFTPQTGDAPNDGDAFNTWLNISQQRRIGLISSAVGSLSGDTLVELRDTITLTVLDSCVVTLTAEKEIGL